MAFFRRVLQGFGFVDPYDMSLLLEGHRAPMMLWWLMSEPPSVVAIHSYRDPTFDLHYGRRLANQGRLISIEAQVIANTFHCDNTLSD